MKRVNQDSNDGRNVSQRTDAMQIANNLLSGDTPITSQSLGMLLSALIPGYVAEPDANIHTPNIDVTPYPLHEAAKRGSVEELNKLAYPFNINSLNERGYSALHYAVLVGAKDVVIWLLKRGAKVGLATEDKSNALHMAAAENRLDIMNALLKYSTEHDISAQDSNYDTPLHIAVKNNFKEIINSLLNSNASLNTKNIDGRDPFHLAVRREDINIVDALLLTGKVNPNSMDNYGNTSLHFAVEKANETIVAKLLSNKADINKANKNRCTPVHYAALNGHLGIMDLLLNNYGVNLNPQDINCNTPMHYAAEKGHEKIISSLAKKGAMINLPNDKKHTPLHVAVISGKQAAASVLLENDANSTARSLDGKTALDYATDNNDVPMQDLILDKVVLKERGPTEANYVERLEREPGEAAIRK